MTLADPLALAQALIRRASVTPADDGARSSGVHYDPARQHALSPSGGSCGSGAAADGSGRSCESSGPSRRRSVGHPDHRWWR